MRVETNRAQRVHRSWLIATTTAVLALAAGSCSTPTDVPGAAFVGLYDAYATVHISDQMGHPLFDMISSTPTQIVHGTMHDLVLNDGQCLLPGDVDSPMHFNVHLPLMCDRMVSVPGMGSGTVHLAFTSGEGTITSQGELTFTAGGTFSFTPAVIPDGGAPDGGAMPMLGMGSFTIESHGSRE